jgi:hypothetical protein
MPFESVMELCVETGGEFHQARTAKMQAKIPRQTAPATSKPIHALFMDHRSRGDAVFSMHILCIRLTAKNAHEQAESLAVPPLSLLAS